MAKHMCIGNPKLEANHIDVWQQGKYDAYKDDNFRILDIAKPWRESERDRGVCEDGWHECLVIWMLWVARVFGSSIKTILFAINHSKVIYTKY